MQWETRTQSLRHQDETGKLRPLAGSHRKKNRAILTDNTTSLIKYYEKYVLRAGLEPARFTATELKSVVATNYTIGAYLFFSVSTSEIISLAVAIRA